VDRCGIFADAGYLFAEAGKLCCGTGKRTSLVCDPAALANDLSKLATDNCGLPVLRIYWYDGATDALPTPEQQKIGELPSVKLRLGRLSGGRQKGVDALIFRDLMTLARERAVATAYLLGGDEDLREGVVAAQDMGVRVVILGIECVVGSNQSDALVRESDEHIILDKAFWSRYIARAKRRAVAPPTTPQPTAYDVGKSFAQGWLQRATSHEIRDLAGQYPRIPREMDIELIRTGEGVFGSLRGNDSAKRELRKGFWNTLRAAP
jgi:hypothetical protein